MMTGEPGARQCALCGGQLLQGIATIPYVLKEAVIVVKNVPAEICSSCHETYTSGVVTDNILALLTRARALQTEVSVLVYGEPAIREQVTLAVD